MPKSEAQLIADAKEIATMLQTRAWAIFVEHLRQESLEVVEDQMRAIRKNPLSVERKRASVDAGYFAGLEHASEWPRSFVNRFVVPATPK